MNVIRLARYVSPTVRERVFRIYGRRCYYCPATEEEAFIEIDHIVPLARGGDNEFLNLLPACETCNRSKGIKTMGEWLEEKRARRETLRAEWQEVDEQIRAIEATRMGVLT